MAVLGEGVKEYKEQSTRLFFLDNLKIALTILVVANHASQAYTNRNTGYPIHQGGDIPGINDFLIGVFLDVNNAFFMALFFLISAYFIPASLERKSTSHFLKDRAKRLLTPVLFFVLLIFPIFGTLFNSDKMSAEEFLIKRYFNLVSGEMQLGHTWFILVLFIFSCTYAIYYKVICCKQTKGLKTLDVPRNGRIVLLTLGLSVVVFMVRIVFQPGYWTIFHLFEPARTALFIGMFAIGTIAYKNKWIEKIPVKTGVIWGIISIIAIIIEPIITKLLLKGPDMWAKGFNLNSFVVSAWDSILCVGLSISLIVLFRQRFNFQNKILRNAANDSFAVYLIHPFVLVVFQGILLNIGIHPMLKFIIVTVVSTVVCYLLSRLIRKLPLVSKII